MEFCHSPAELSRKSHPKQSLWPYWAPWKKKYFICLIQQLPDRVPLHILDNKLPRNFHGNTWRQHSEFSSHLCPSLFLTEGASLYTGVSCPWTSLGQHRMRWQWNIFHAADKRNWAVLLALPLTSGVIGTKPIRRFEEKIISVEKDLRDLNLWSTTLSIRPWH